MVLDNEVVRPIGYSLFEISLIFVVLISITYGLYRYFYKLLNPQDFSAESAGSESLSWNQVTEEISKGERIESLWTRAFSDADGDVSKAKARYIKLRVQQLQLTHLQIGSHVPKDINFNPKNINLIFGLICVVGIGGLCILVIDGKTINRIFGDTKKVVEVQPEIKEFGLYSCTRCDEGGKCTSDDYIKSFIVNTGNGEVTLRFKNYINNINATSLVKSECAMNNINAKYSQGFNFICENRNEKLSYDGIDLLNVTSSPRSVLRCGVRNN